MDVETPSLFDPVEPGPDARDAIRAVAHARVAYCKFLSANDTGLTGAHQSGLYIAKDSYRLLFDTPGMKGENKSREVRFTWPGGLETPARFIWYGSKSRSEYRITRFGRGFPYLKPELTGSLMVIVKDDPESYRGWVLDNGMDIDAFLDAFALGPTETGHLIDTNMMAPETLEREAILEQVEAFGGDFPASDLVSRAARVIDEKVRDHGERVRTDPDGKLVAWTETEYALFRAIEHAHYDKAIHTGFDSLDGFLDLANTVLNRRKSRAGKSLENQLAAVFDGNDISYTPQARTEGNRRPDFIFPSQAAYHDPMFRVEGLTSLAAKTTCKDRWRQILVEAERLKGGRIYLCTLQQGISETQMDEMEDEKVTLVVPKPYIGAYPPSRRDRIWTLGTFVDYVKEKQQDQ
ncbi:restriction endonuclease [Bifidobacterium rousetti]|uniref:type II restriction endonuclease n=1 Tax=Bifidobacterium rousetti TaxID=2045439 RepID=UPI00123C6192|nr:type II restriction endonuclease [Bifidobacterium rousetti]KAA8818322.1 restriction endonuclease [Bifidobacterium rousetti]